MLEPRLPILFVVPSMISDKPISFIEIRVGILSANIVQTQKKTQCVIRVPVILSYCNTKMLNMVPIEKQTVALDLPNSTTKIYEKTAIETNTDVKLKNEN